MVYLLYASTPFLLNTMIVRSIGYCEKDVVPLPTMPIAVASNTPTLVLNDISGLNGEYASRAIQNTGANAVYYAFGRDCDNTNYNGILASQQQLDCSNHGAKVSVYCASNTTTIGITILVRNDNAQGQGGIITAGGVNP